MYCLVLDGHVLPCMWCGGNVPCTAHLHRQALLLPPQDQHASLREVIVGQVDGLTGLLQAKHGVPGRSSSSSGSSSMRT